VLFLLLSAPFFVPITLRLGLDKSRRDWSVHVGTLQVAPEGERHFEQFRRRWTRRLKPLRVVGTYLLQGLVFLMRGLFLAARGVLWLLKSMWFVISQPLRLLRSRKSDSGPPETTLDDSHTDPEAPSEQQNAEEESDAEPEDDDSGEIRLPPSPSEMNNQSADGETSPPRDVFEDLDDVSGDAGTHQASDELPGMEESSNSRGVLSTIRDGFAMLNAYGPLGRKILSAIFRFVGDVLRAPKWRRLDGRLTFGGDPAALGAMLGWYNALMYSIHPRLADDLVFDPDFDNEDTPLSGSLDVAVVIWPYRFMLATFRLIVRIPWIGVYKAYRKYRAGELIPAPSAGVA
jgi:hypothetical protein